MKSRLFFAPEDGGASGASGAGAPDPSIVSGNSGASGGAQGGGSSGQAQTPPSSASGAPEPSWRDTITSFADESDREAIAQWMSRFTDPKAAMKGLLDTRKAATSRPPLPNEQSKPEERHEFFKALGKPDKPEEYGFAKYENDDVANARLGEFATFAHELNLTKDQAGKLKDWFDTQDRAATDAHIARLKTLRTENEGRLKQLWGHDYDTNISLANEAAGFFFSSAAELDAYNSFMRTPLADGSVPGNHPVMLQMLAKIGRSLAEDQTLRRFDTPAGQSDLDTQIKAIQDEAVKAGKSTAEEPYHSRLQPLYDKRYGKKPLNFRAW